VRGATLQRDDVVEHFFVTTTHHWILFFTNLGRVYRTKAYMLPETARDAKGKHVANLLAFQPDEQIAGVLALQDYEQAPYLVLATKDGLVKKTALTEYDTNRTGGLIAINLRDGDELVSARLVDDAGELIMVSAKGMSVRFRADDLRAMGRATSGVIGMRFRTGDHTLAMDVVRPDCDLVTVTDEGFAKRTPLQEWATKGRAGLGVRAMKLVAERGSLVGALVCQPDDSIFAIASNGVVIRTPVADIRQTGRDTMGVHLMGLGEGVTVVAVARAAVDADDSDPAPAPGTPAGEDGASLQSGEEE
jgi:DNA gyrase subunit A